MSKAFTKEDGPTGPEPALPYRVPLPEGTPNLITPAGAERLRAELAGTSGEREAAAAEPDPEARARRLAEVDRRVEILTAHLSIAQVVDPATQPRGRVGFGAWVEVADEAGATRRYRIVGIDEVDVPGGCIGWRAPLAQALLGAEEGDVVVVRTPRGEEELEILSIHY